MVITWNVKANVISNDLVQSFYFIFWFTSINWLIELFTNNVNIFSVQCLVEQYAQATTGAIPYEKIRKKNRIQFFRPKLRFPENQV